MRRLFLPLSISTMFLVVCAENSDLTDATAMSSTADCEKTYEAAFIECVDSSEEDLEGEDLEGEDREGEDREYEDCEEEATIAYEYCLSVSGESIDHEAEDREYEDREDGDREG